MIGLYEEALLHKPRLLRIGSFGAVFRLERVPFDDGHIRPDRRSRQIG